MSLIKITVKISIKILNTKRLQATMFNFSVLDHNKSSKLLTLKKIIRATKKQAIKKHSWENVFFYLQKLTFFSKIENNPMRALGKIKNPFFVMRGLNLIKQKKT